MLIKFRSIGGKCTRLFSTMSKSGVTIEEQKVKVGDFDINFVISKLEENKNPQKSLLMLPGAMGSAFTDFKPQLHHLPQLLPNYQIIAWDPPGYGRSIPPARNFTTNFLENDADCAKSLMDVLKIPTYDLLGWSDGGITAMILAGKFPEKVQKLAFFGSNAFIVAKELEIYEKIRDVSKWSAKMRQPLEELYGADYFRENWEKWVDTFKKIYEERDGNLCREFLNKIQAEILILHGEKDPMLAEVHVPFLMTELKNAKLVTWPDGKHNIHLRYAEEFNKKVAEFFGGK